MINADMIDDTELIELGKDLRKNYDQNTQKEENFDTKSSVEYVCKKCKNKVVTGLYIEALDSIWCPEHFTCSDISSGRLLEELGFKEYKGDAYCINCYPKLVGPDCPK